MKAAAFLSGLLLVLCTLAGNMSAQDIDQTMVSVASQEEVPSQQALLLQDNVVADEEPGNSSNIIVAPDYTMPLNGLVEFFKSRRQELTSLLNDWAKAANDEVEGLYSARDKVEAAEEELKDMCYSECRKYTKSIADKRAAVVSQRADYTSLKQKLAESTLATTTELRNIEKQDLKLIADAFKTAMKSIGPTAAYPSDIFKDVNVFFSEPPTEVEMPWYLSPVNELLFWYWNVEQSYRGEIEECRMKIGMLTEDDKKLRDQQTRLQEELAQYGPKDPKVYKSEIGSLKKQITQVEKERKALAKELSNDSKALSNRMKNLNIELQAAYKERINHIIEEINYMVAERGDI